MLINKKNLAILEVQSESGNSSKMEFTVIERLRELKLTPTVDDYGNIYAIRGRSTHYPMLTAHLDTVHDIIPDYKVVYAGNTVRAYDSKMRPTGIGGDDKCGIIAIFEIIERTKHPIKIAFFKDEEIGCKGSAEADISFMDDVSYIVGIDRNGRTDILTGYKDFNISTEFKKLLPDDDILKIKSQDTITDSAEVGGDCSISNVNISCGYFLPHSDNEYIDLDDLHHAINYVIKMLREIPLLKIYTLDKDPNDRYVSYTPSYYNSDAWESQRKNGGYWDYKKNEWVDYYSKEEREYYGLDDLGDDTPPLNAAKKFNGDSWDDDDDDEYLYRLEDVCDYFDGDNDTNATAMLTHYGTYTEFIQEFKLKYGKELMNKLIDDINFYECDVNEYFDRKPTLKLIKK